jgi:hypothetical protein
MRLSAPKNITFWIAVVLGMVGFLGALFTIGANSLWLWLLFLGFALLAVATLIDGL